MRCSLPGMCALATASLFVSSSTIMIVDAAIVDAGALTTVSVETSFFDNQTGDCGSGGCDGTLTRDGDSTTPESRWSCKPELGPSGSACSIFYTVGESLNLQTLHIALYKGDTRTRTLDVFIDDTLYTTWTSSGTTTDFEAIDLSGEAGGVIELQGVLADSEWLSITEVEILVDSDVVEAGTLGTVETSATLYDTRLSEDNGCDPSGCVPSLTRDGDFTEGSRWSCATQLGGNNAECAISYDMGDVRDLTALRLALFRGNERTRTMQINVDGNLATTWTSSGTTAGLERIDLAGTSGRVLEVVAVASSSSEFLSIVETEILVQEDNDGTAPTPIPTPSPSTVPMTRTTADGRLIVEVGELGLVEIPGQSVDLNEDGCGALGCVEANTRDGLLGADNRWSCRFDVLDDDNRPFRDRRCRVVYILPYPVEFHSLRIAFHEGDSEAATLSVLVDDVTVVDQWTSSGTTLDFQTVSLAGINGQSIQLIADSLEDDDFLDITEVAIDVIIDDVPLMGVSASERINVGVSTSSLDGLPVLDSDITAASSWACMSSGSDVCSITIDLQNSESVEQISIAFVDDAEISDNVFDVSIGYSADGPFTMVLTDIPSNKDRSETLQQFKISRLARYVKIEASALGSGSLHISEIDVRVSEYVPSHAVTTGASLGTVGVIPLARGTRDFRTEAEGGCGTRGCLPFYVKDGNLDTFWRCFTNDHETPDSDSFQCDLRFDLAYFRQLKQIRIALADGAERASNLVFEAPTPYELNEQFSNTIISSGTTADFETYDFDHFVDSVTIAGLFRNVGESISISGIEFLEEPYDDGIIPVAHSGAPTGGAEPQPAIGFGWGSSSISGTSTLTFRLNTYASVTAVELKFPVGERYSFDLIFFDETNTVITQEGFLSTDEEDFQSFPLELPGGYVVEDFEIAMKGTAGGDSSFFLLDARIIGTAVDNPTTEYTIGSAAFEGWGPDARYPDVVTEGTGDQRAIMEAICSIKRASFDGVDCVGDDPNATGTLVLPPGDYFLNGNIFMKSGVVLDGRFSGDDGLTTEFFLEEGAAGNTDIPALIVFDGVVNAKIEDIWMFGTYDPDTDNSISAVPGLGSMGLEITNSENITAKDFMVEYIDGDAVVVTNSKWVDIDASSFDEELIPWPIANSRGTGLLLDTCDSVYIRRHDIYNNGVAGLHITGSYNVTFEATIDNSEEVFLGEGNVGRLNGQQPIEIIIESSTLVIFNDMRVTSSNEPAITVSGDSSEVIFNNGGFPLVESGMCVIQTEDPTVVSAVDDELVLDGDCFVKV